MVGAAIRVWEDGREAVSMAAVVVTSPQLSKKGSASQQATF